MGTKQAVTGRDRALSLYRKACGELNKAFLASGDGLALIAGRARAVDELLLALSRRVFSPSLDAPAGFCLIALGGYGREELFPYSDVDVLLLFERQVGQAVGREAMSEFLRELWDAGLRVGHTVRLLSECSRLDAGNTEFSIAALDSRFLAGDPRLFVHFKQQAIPALVRRDKDGILKNLTALAELRHGKHGETIYHLEPDLKESPGGLRDYQLACWVAQILRAGDAGVPSRDELPEINREEVKAAFAFLTAARAHVHLLAGRDSNTLTFDMQARVAARFQSSAIAEGTTGSDAGQDDEPEDAGTLPDEPASGAVASAAAAHLAAERWTRQYYRHARVIARVAEQALRQASGIRSGLSQWFKQRQERFSNADFAVHSGEVFVRNPMTAQRDPTLWLDLFEFQARHNLVLSLETERRVERHAPEIAQWARQARDLWPRFERILSQPHAYVALSTMHETGLLVALFPEFQLIESLVIRDLYHKYTVDEHSLLAIANVQKLKDQAAAKNSGEHGSSRLPAELYSELDRPELLLLALLFHDLGKSAPSEHVSASARLTKQVLDRLVMDDDDRETVLFLVENHLAISNAVMSIDVSESRALREFCECIGTVERLKMLYLVTWADIKSVNPTALTPWKEETLSRFYMTAHAELTRELDTDRTSPDEAAVIFRPEVAAFLDGLPRRYLRTHTPAQVLAHSRMARELESIPVCLALMRKQAAWELIAVTSDHPFLFAAITGTLAAKGMNIVKAEAFSNRHRVVVDTFRFVDLHRTLELNPEECDGLLDALREAIVGKADVGRMLEGRLEPPPLGRTTYHVETTLRFDNSASASSTLLEVVTRDRLGLLYRIANVLSAHGCNIEVVLVDTQGHKAIDVFYLTREGAQIAPEWQVSIAKELRRVLDAFSM